MKKQLWKQTSCRKGREEAQQITKSLNVDYEKAEKCVILRILGYLCNDLTLINARVPTAMILNPSRKVDI